jgi:serine/threonine protein phosphatase PrpC
MGLRHCHFFAVCDGHGQFGREVSGMLKHRLPFILENQLKADLQNYDLNNYPDKEVVF